jgi:hypothetical protein
MQEKLSLNITGIPVKDGHSHCPQVRRCFLKLVDENSWGTELKEDRMNRILRKQRKTCLDCQQRQARFRYRGKIKWDKDHSLCFACFRTVRDQVQAQQLV